MGFGIPAALTGSVSGGHTGGSGMGLCTKNSSRSANYACTLPRIRGQGRRSGTISHAYQVVSVAAGSTEHDQPQNKTTAHSNTENQQKYQCVGMAYCFFCGFPLLPPDWTYGQAYGLDNMMTLIHMSS